MFLHCAASLCLCSTAIVVLSNGTYRKLMAYFSIFSCCRLAQQAKVCLFLKNVAKGIFAHQKVNQNER